MNDGVIKMCGIQDWGIWHSFNSVGDVIAGIFVAVTVVAMLLAVYDVTRSKYTNWREVFVLFPVTTIGQEKVWLKVIYRRFVPCYSGHYIQHATLIDILKNP